MPADTPPGSSLTEVSFAFAAQGVSATFRVVSLHMVEAISEPFVAAVEVAPPTPSPPRRSSASPRC